MSDLTVEQFQAVVPKSVKKKVNQELVDHINGLVQDPEMREMYRDNIISYASVMQDGKFKVSQYLDAVRYVSYKLMGDTNTKAYVKTFPDKYARFKAQGVVDKDIASYITAYNKGKLVNLIFEQTIVPSHVLNQEMYQRALNAQADLMMNAKSEKVRSDAANSILTHLKPPETKKIELDVGVKDSGAISELKQTTMELVAQQKRMIAAGVNNPKEVAESKVIQGEFEEI